MTHARTVARWLLGAFLLFTGIGHLTFARQAFVAQVPQWLPLPVDVVVLAAFFVAARGIRLLFQPVLVVWALWSTGAWRAWRAWRDRRRVAAGR
ncbi:MAG: hypothetical protein IE924_01735 [Microbacterium sp.]|uniref:hypothetical protein n=1 Tax=Microbacterium sp. TaxID=51671 RepID=UPI00198D769D|nr:hypothetical protein [Microbacterium sp.]MBD3756812.1 hypothetical protein [Microbacterium sp.]